MKKVTASLLIVLVLLLSLFTVPALAENPIDSAVSWALAIANNSKHGYDQNYRWGPDYDCSALLITAYQQAGVPVKTNGATFTGNMRDGFLKSGFSDITKSINLSTGSGLKKGDVLVRPYGHTVMVSSVSGTSITIVHASVNEKGTATGGQTGDQTGKEICTRSYYNGSWEYVLRYNYTPPATEIPVVSGTYFQKYTGSSTSIVTALDAIGVDSSYSYRSKIATANGISGYSGTAAQNTKMLDLLKAGQLINPDGTAPSYFARYTGTSTSIVTALNAIGVDSSYSFRSKIAAANGISGYSGTADQNTKMLDLLKGGKLINPNGAPVVSYYPRYTGTSTSIVTALNAIGVDSSYSFRSKIAAANGISGYSGTASQNTQMLDLLKAGKLKKV